MTKPSAFLAALFAAAPSAAWAGLPVPAALRAVSPELLACALVTLAVLLLAFLGLRRSLGAEERAHALRLQLAAEREARSHAEQALAEHHDVLCRLVRRQEGVREGERSRIARDLNDQLGSRLSRLRTELSCLQDGVDAAPQLASRLDGALANIDGAITAVRAVAGGLRPIGQQEGLRQALQHVLQDQSRLSGLRYRFDAGTDPAAPPAERAARLAVFRVLQEVAASAGRRGAAELHVRLAEGADRLSLQIDGDAAIAEDSLPDELRERLHALDASLCLAEPAPGRRRMTLSIPAREVAELA
ncbi:histidine kinase [Massilia sp. ZL223]|uniref:histidine kinase n=1 Tax=Massilia sp. ZL223 TaxID=2824904 RepID=UPI001B840885|nr:histidine kinase [Massilia sp. ZL223]MBQ5964448.1 hypothetical protein [Massilia sp. ZL223]